MTPKTSQTAVLPGTHPVDLIYEAWCAIHGVVDHHAGHCLTCLAPVKKSQAA
jgi:hypothetical protein